MAGTSATTAADYKLFCLLHGDSPDLAFAVNITGNATFSDLQTFIKTKISPELDHIPSNKLTLYAANVAPDTLTDWYKNKHDKLSPLIEISTIYSDMSLNGKIHIIIDPSKKCKSYYYFRF